MENPVDKKTAPQWHAWIASLMLGTTFGVITTGVTQALVG